MESVSTSKHENGTVIQLLNTAKPGDVGVHINTTLSIASSKKIKLLFILNFLLSVLCMAVSCSIAFYYWNEMIAMRRQLDMIKDHYIVQNMNDLGKDRIESSPLVSQPKVVETREPKMVSEHEGAGSPRKYYVENFGEDMLFVDSNKKSTHQVPSSPVSNVAPLLKEPFVAHFNGASREMFLGTNAVIGPWVRDVDVSTKNSESRIELDGNSFNVHEGGVYLIYMQVVYLTHAPNCYFLWAQQAARELRLLTSCATGDDSSGRALDKSQIACSTQTVARLHAGDVLKLAQREHNRTLWLRQGYSYIGFVKLSS